MVIWLKNFRAAGKKTARKKAAAALLAGLLLFACAFTAGSLWGIDAASAASGRLNTQFGRWTGGGEDASITVGYAGWYNITVYGGANGGRLTGIVLLKEGDVLRSQVFEGGVAPSGIESGGGFVSGGNGGQAVMIFLNNTPLIGAGGGGGATRAGGSGVPVVITNGAGVDRIENQYFSSGGSGALAYRSAGATTGTYLNGAGGNTLPGHTPSAGGTYSPARGGAAGANYLDEDLIDLLSQPNGSAAAGFVVEVSRSALEDTYMYSMLQTEYMRGMAQSLANLPDNAAALERIAVAIENLPFDSVPRITVVAGKPFSVAVAKYDDMPSGSAGGVTVTNSVVGDGVVVISGTAAAFPSPGIFSVTVNNRVFSVTAVSEPDSSNVTVVF